MYRFQIEQLVFRLGDCFTRLPSGNVMEIWKEFLDRIKSTSLGKQGIAPYNNFHNIIIFELH